MKRWRLSSEIQLQAIKASQPWRSASLAPPAPKPACHDAPAVRGSLDSETSSGAGVVIYRGKATAYSRKQQVYPLVGMCEAAGLPVPIPEWQFHAERHWRLDFAWPLRLVSVEIDGGVWNQGAHSRGAGIIKDQQKRNCAQLLGWKVFVYTPDRLDECVGDLRIEFAKETP